MSGDWRGGVSLGPVTRQGEWAVAGVARWDLSAYVGDSILAAHGRKEPVAILVEGQGRRVALSPDGKVLTAEALEALAPALWQAFETALDR